MKQAVQKYLDRGEECIGHFRVQNEQVCTSKIYVYFDETLKRSLSSAPATAKSLLGLMSGSKDMAYAPLRNKPRKSKVNRSHLQQERQPCHEQVAVFSAEALGKQRHGG